MFKKRIFFFLIIFLFLMPTNFDLLPAGHMCLAYNKYERDGKILFTIRSCVEHHAFVIFSRVFLVDSLLLLRRYVLLCISSQFYLRNASESSLNVEWSFERVRRVVFFVLSRSFIILVKFYFLRAFACRICKEE